ncbi:MAG TPA: hypothetical protein VM537_32195 [Anaerolineae bacterium]|nr:hypothetical protein [Anaerolineae bacterium]
MKWLLSTIALFAVLGGCGPPPAPTPPVPEAATTPTAILEETQDRATRADPASQSSVGRFDVYLVKQDISPQQMTNANLAELQLEETPLLSIEDIVTYAWATHEIELTPSASERVARLESSRLSMGGLPFVICAGGEPIYGGALWTSYSSATYDGIVINVYPASSGQPLPIRLGYPSPEWFKGEDLRSDPRILRSLQEAGKLR